MGLQSGIIQNWEKSQKDGKLKIEEVLNYLSKMVTKEKRKQFEISWEQWVSGILGCSDDKKFI